MANTNLDTMRIYDFNVLKKSMKKMCIRDSEDGDYTLDVSDEEIICDFDENDMEFLENSISVDFSKLYNVVTVIGANINGDLITYTAQNENPKSQSNIWTVEPNTLRVQDDNKMCIRDRLGVA